MHIIRSTSSSNPAAPVAPQLAGGAVVAIGNFDGVHLGHREVVAQGRKLALKHGLPLWVLTFEPHPRAVLRPDVPLRRLCSFAEKARRLQALGVDGMYVVHFTKTYAKTTADAFMAETLHQSLNAQHIVVGEDFKFGQGRAGDVAMLEKAGKMLGFTVHPIPPVQALGAVCSSSRIRQLLAEGDRATAALLLGQSV